MEYFLNEVEVKYKKGVERGTYKISSSDSIAKFLQDLQDETQEKFLVICLSQANMVEGVQVVHVGGISTSLVDPRIVFRLPLLTNSTKIIVAHNHPSGDPAPSDADKEVTKGLLKGGETLHIALLDHIILGRDGRFFSFADSGLIK
jgi:DNA repair protein RadC